jgi:hypothetical protein
MRRRRRHRHWCVSAMSWNRPRWMGVPIASDALMPSSMSSLLMGRAHELGWSPFHREPRLPCLAGRRHLRARDRFVCCWRGTRLGSVPIAARERAHQGAAVDVAEDGDKHRRDLALLLTAVEDPRSLRTELLASERGWLRSRRELLDPRHSAWRTTPQAGQARIALEILSG